jgi:gluconokinase
MILLVAGVAGSGKTTVGRVLAGELGWTFADGDSFHPPGNVAKMRAGTPLTDEDRLPWLRSICAWIDERVAAGESAVITCSALKRSYRELLLTGRPAKMAFLAIGEHDDEARLQRRAGHFFPEGLVASQFAVLEPPTAAEPNVVVITSSRTPELTAQKIIRQFGLAG